MFEKERRAAVREKRKLIKTFMRMLEAAAGFELARLRFELVFGRMASSVTQRDRILEVGMKLLQREIRIGKTLEQLEEELA